MKNEQKVLRGIYLLILVVFTIFTVIMHFLQNNQTKQQVNSERKQIIGHENSYTSCNANHFLIFLMSG